MDLFKYLLEAHDKISTYFSTHLTQYSTDELVAVRTEAFKLEAFGRILKRAGKKSSDEGQMIRTLGDNLKTSAEFIEDSIGELLYHTEMKAHDKSKCRLEEATLRFTIVKSDFEQHLNWIAKSLDVLQNLDLRALYLIGLSKELKKLNDSIEDIDPELLEDGTHNLRRKIRWVVMHIIYPNGLFQYKEKNPKTNDFTKLGKPKGLPSVKISFETIEFLSNAVFELGNLKDEGLAANYSKTKSELNSSNPHIVESTKKILNELKRKKVLKSLRREIKEQM